MKEALHPGRIEYSTRMIQMSQTTTMTSAEQALNGEWKGRSVGRREPKTGTTKKMQPRSLKALLVEGDSKFACAMRESLSSLTGARIDLRTSETLDEALRHIRSEHFDAILLNLFLSDSQGLSTFARIRAQAPTMPIIIVTSCDNDTLALESVRQGAQDYLVKSKVDGKILSRVVRYAIERKRVERRLAAQHAVTSVLAESASLTEATPRILQATCESLELEMGALWKVDGQAAELRCVAVWHVPGAHIPEFEAITRGSIFSKGAGLPGRIWATGKPSWIANVVEDANFPRAPIAAREGLHAAFGFPVRVDREILGVIEFFSRQIQQPDQDLLHMMTNIGSQIGQFMVRKEAEEALAEERNVLRTLIDTLPDAIYVKDTQSRFILGNSGVARLMGAPMVESIVGKTDFDFFPADLAQRYFADERAVLKTGQPLINREEPVVDPSGRPGWLLTSKAPLRDTRGRIVGLVGMGRDITDRKREEEQHRLSETRLQAILDNTTAVIYLKDTQGRYLLINRQFEELFHVTREQVVHKTDYDLFPGTMADAFRVNDQRVLETRTPLEFEEVAPRDGEIRTFISIKFPLSDTTGVPYAVCGISTDITERKRAETKLVDANAELLEMNTELARGEEALRAALVELQASHEELKATQLQLIQAEKMESVGNLAAGVAHEVKNPLQTILMGLAYLSKNIPAGDENLALVLTDMHDAVKRADAIVRDLLCLSASKQLEIMEEDFNSVVEHSLWFVNYELTRSRVSLIRELSADLPRVRLDKAKMEQVFINLFMNAIQAMPQGGTLTVRTSVRRLTGLAHRDERTLGHLNAGDTVVVTEIQDSGNGIPDEKLPRIFEPFFTTKPTGVGTGLGLPVTKQIIDMHGGTISIGPGTNGGVRVTLMLNAEKGGEYEQKEDSDSGR